MFYWVAYGIVFGVPLGFFVAGRVWLYWLVFVVGAFTAGLLWSLARSSEIYVFLLTLSSPIEWLYLFAVACFAYIGVYLRNRVERRATAAAYRVVAATSTLLVATIGGVGWYLIESPG